MPIIMNVNSAGKKQAYRHRQEIIYTILNAAQDPKTRIRLVYESMISWEQCSEYLEELMNRGLLQHNQFDDTYFATARGLRFIELYERLRDEFDHDDK
jgi:predicted transcriptional regulator